MWNSKSAWWFYFLSAITVTPYYTLLNYFKLIDDGFGRFFLIMCPKLKSFIFLLMKSRKEAISWQILNPIGSIINWWDLVIHYGHRHRHSAIHATAIFYYLHLSRLLIRCQENLTLKFVCFFCIFSFFLFFVS